MITENDLTMLPPHVLDVPVSVFQDVWQRKPCETPLLSQVLSRIQSGAYSTEVEQVRRILHSQGEAAYKQAKERLSCMTPCCTMRTRDQKIALADKVERASNIVHFDLDKLDDHDGVKAQLRDNPHVAFVFTSPRGNGLKIGIAASGITTDNYKFAWYSILRDLKQQYPGGEFVEDHAIQYINALCFVSDDPGLYMNSQAM